MAIPSGARLTAPRKRRIGIALAAFGVYSALGFFALPPLVSRVATQYAAETLHLDLRVRHVEVNPWRLAVRLDDLRIAEPGGEALVGARSLYVNINALGSLWHLRADVDDLDVLQPRVNARIDSHGRLNLLQLVPPDDPRSQKTPWRLAVLGVHGGYVGFTDQSRPTPFTATFAPLDFRLFNLASAAAGEGRYRLSAETGQQERLDWEGALGMNPVRSDGTLSIGGLQAKTVSAYLQNTLPVDLTGGRINISGRYRFLLQDKPQLALEQVSATVSDLAFRTVAARRPVPGSLEAVRVDDMRFSFPAGDLQVGKVRVDKLLLGEGASPLLTMAGMTLDKIAWSPSQDTAGLGVLQIRDLRVPDERRDAALTVDALRIDGLSAQPAAQRLDSGAIALQGGKLAVAREKSGVIDWSDRAARLAERLAPAAEPGAGRSAAKPWQVTLGRLSVKDFHVDAEDRAPARAVRLPILLRAVEIQPRAAADQPHAVSADVLINSAPLRVAGDVSESPPAANLKLDLQRLALPPLSPYLAQLARFQLESGDLDVNGRLSVRLGKSLEATYTGGFGVRNFAANDQFLHERFLAWKQLRFNGVDARLSPLKVKVREVAADQPFTRLIILPDKTLNLSQILAATNDAKPTAAVKSASAPPQANIDRVVVTNGSMLFADLSLKPQFATGIESLQGDIRGISTQPDSQADIHLNGRVDQYGSANISGRLNPVAPDAHTDIAVKFDNVELTTLTPYSAKFAGYRIDKGKLSLDLNYAIRARKLEATNKIVLNQLTLGDKVDSPDAMNLPLRLAVAILKDSRGVIDIDLPLSGSLDDPRFRVGPLVWKAFVNVITKVATAPFRFIAGLVGGGEDMDQLGFAPGVTTLSADIGARLDKMGQALQSRPELRLEVRGVYDPKADSAVLRAHRIDEALAAMAAKQPDAARALQQLYGERLGAEALKRQLDMARRPAADGSLALSPAALNQALRRELEAREAVDDGELRQLALDRARGIRQYLIEHDKVDGGRVFVLEPEAGGMTADRVISRLGLAAQ